MICCKEATLLSLKKHERKIGLKGQFDLWLHLLFCKFCRAFEKQAKWLHDIAAHLSLKEKFTDSERSALRIKFNEAQKPT